MRQGHLLDWGAAGGAAAALAEPALEHCRKLVAARREDAAVRGQTDEGGCSSVIWLPVRVLGQDEDNIGWGEVVVVVVALSLLLGVGGGGVEQPLEVGDEAGRI